jgi:hypothetical protein
MRKLVLATAALIALASPAAAGGDGHYWLKECSKSSAICRGYIAGVADTSRPCGMSAVGRTIKSAEMQAAVVRYLSNNPRRLDMRGNAIVLEALDANWPCKTQTAERQKQQAAQADFDEYVRKPSEPTSSSDDDLNALPTNDKEMLALAAVLTVNYSRCGGTVSREQWESISRTMHDLGSEVAGVARVVERENCQKIRTLYHTMRAAAAQVPRLTSRNRKPRGLGGAGQRS